MIWVALIGPEFEENLSLRYLSSSLEQAGYRSQVIAFNDPQDLPQVLRAVLEGPKPPVLVGVSLAFQWRAVEMMALVIGLREAGYTGHITTGGHFATFSCQELLSDFGELSSVCRQEAERTVVELVRALERGTSLESIPGLALRDDHGKPRLTPLRSPPDLDELPTPDRRRPPRGCFGHSLAPLVGSRGCYANCTFCCIAAWHEQSLPGKRYRLRRPEDVADEMIALQRDRGIEIFVFHDDNFFVPSARRNLERINALADAVEERGIGRFGVVVKARPNDVDREVFRVLRDRLYALRVYVGIETDADQGLVTLARGIDSRQNHEAINTLGQLGLFACFNLLVFDPDTTLASFETNLAFMAAHAEVPFNFCRTELYAGTPLLQRMQAEQRAYGDYFSWGYKLRNQEIQRVFELSIKAFTPRNFGVRALHNDIGGWRLQLETCRHFHPEAFRDEWLHEMKALHRRVGTDTVSGLRAIVAHVGEHGTGRDPSFVRALAPELRRVEREVTESWHELRARIGAACEATQLKTSSIGPDATPLQNATEVSYV